MLLVFRRLTHATLARLSCVAPEIMVLCVCVCVCVCAVVGYDLVMISTNGLANAFSFASLAFSVVGYRHDIQATFFHGRN